MDIIVIKEKIKIIKPNFGHFGHLFAKKYMEIRVIRKKIQIRRQVHNIPWPPAPAH